MNSTKFITILEELRYRNSQNEKKQILTKYSAHYKFKQSLYMMYNPYKNYYIKAIPVVTNNGSEEYNFDYMINILNQLNDREITGNAAKVKIIDFMEKCELDLFEIFQLILCRDLKSGVGITMINNIYNNLIPKFSIALASAEKQINNIKFPAYAQMKGDGRRTLIRYYNNTDDGITFLTRSGNIDSNLKFDSMIRCIKQYLKPGYVYDGEAIMEDENGFPLERKFSNGMLARKNIDAEYMPKIKILIWDMIPITHFDNLYSEISYKDRFNTLSSLLKTSTKHLKLIQNDLVKNINEAKKIANNYIKNGYEGAIIKNINVPYEGKRTKHMIKIKAELETDLEVIDWVEGTGIFKNYLGALTCATSDRKLIVSVGSGFSHEQRGLKIIDTNTMLTEAVDTEFSPNNIIGKIISVKYNEIIQNNNKDTYSLFLPRFVELRKDKHEADSIQKLLDESNKK